MTANDDDVAEEAGEDIEEVERGGGRIASTISAEADGVIIIVFLVFVGAIILAFVYYKAQIGSSGLGAINSGLS
ncbi:MAG: hypothetical protein QW292_12650, partial [Candidatus Parvarchaeota archaeon]